MINNILHEFNKNEVKGYKYNKFRNHRLFILLIPLPGVV